MVSFVVVRFIVVRVDARRVEFATKVLVDIVEPVRVE